MRGAVAAAADAAYEPQLDATQPFAPQITDGHAQSICAEEASGSARHMARNIILYRYGPTASPERSVLWEVTLQAAIEPCPTVHFTCLLRRETDSKCATPRCHWKEVPLGRSARRSLIYIYIYIY